MYIIYDKLTDTLGQVRAVIHNPYPEQIVDNGIDIETEIPQPKEIPNMDAYLRINLETSDLYYDYIARETFETKISSLQQENSELKQAIADLTATLAAVMAG
ncbi:hypothetical protein BCV73_08945 [Paenibacillus sp. SSG-1]|uniref:hypothetical protein n=1 Tax=Paenibacillus sp. SSG-1 TaxID=1443669 RepID=UPI000B7D07CD|nr:hypothetical protein [Paenibacillus sp. SSG-1]OXL83192.1 hypothetical protein BCV73_08945 [Paenibacillus sp. SSG-1]